MLKGGPASRSGAAVRSNPGAGAGDVNFKVSSSNTSGKKRLESASTSAAGVAAPRSKEMKQTSAQSPQGNIWFEIQRSEGACFVVVLEFRDQESDN